MQDIAGNGGCSRREGSERAVERKVLRWSCCNDVTSALIKVVGTPQIPQFATSKWSTFGQALAPTKATSQPNAKPNSWQQKLCENHQVSLSPLCLFIQQQQQRTAPASLDSRSSSWRESSPLVQNIDADPRSSAWEIISSTLFLLIFLGVVCE